MNGCVEFASVPKPNKTHQASMWCGGSRRKQAARQAGKQGSEQAYSQPAANAA